MEIRELGKLAAGAAIYKIQDTYLPKYVTYSVAGIDLAKVGLGVAEIAAACLGEKYPATKTVTDALGVAGITQIVSEIAKAVVPAAGARAVTVTTVAPAPVAVERTLSLV